MAALAERRMKLRLRWRETPESLEKRLMQAGNGSSLPYGDKILMTGFYYNGPGCKNWYGAVYEALEDGELDPETDLGLAEISPGFFRDEGHAMEWAIKTAGGVR